MKEKIEQVERLLESAKEEISWSQNPHKDKSTKEVYLSNAIRFIDVAIDIIKAGDRE